jgi:hypothetical protein
MIGRFLGDIPDVSGRTDRYRRARVPGPGVGAHEGSQMMVRSDPRDLVRAVVLADYRPFEASIEIVKEKRAGKDAAFAVSLEDRDGAQRRGVIGLRRHHGGTWQQSGDFMGSAHVNGDRDLWMTRGGWASDDSRERAMFGGWVADPAAVSARLIDAEGRCVDDDPVTDGVVLFMWKGAVDLRNARLELLDAQQRVVRAGPAH